MKNVRIKITTINGRIYERRVKAPDIKHIVDQMCGKSFNEATFLQWPENELEESLMVIRAKEIESMEMVEV